MSSTAVKPVKTSDISPTLSDRSTRAMQRAKRAVLLGRTVNQAALQLNRKIDHMLIQLEFRFAVNHADDALKQRGLEIIADFLQRSRQPSTAAMLAFLSEAKKTTSVSL